MLRPTDLVCLPYAGDLSAGGIEYALRGLADLPGPPGDLRQRAAQGAVELAFRRHLSQRGSAYEVEAGPPFAGPQRFDVTLGGRRCELKTFFISRPRQVRDLLREPGAVLNAPALVASDRQAGDEGSEHDLYVFAFAAGLPQADPPRLVHAMPAGWRRPAAWVPLGPLTLKAEADAEVEILGQGADGGLLSRRLDLPAGKRIEAGGDLHSITALHTVRPPSARIGLHAPARGDAHIIQPADWENLQIGGGLIVLAGFISRARFRRSAVMIAPNTPVYQYDRTKIRNLAVPVSSLEPMADLAGPVQN